MAKKRRSASRKKHEYPGWAWGVFGLAIGLSVAAAVWVKGQQARYEERQQLAVATERRPAASIAPDPAPPSNLDDNGEAGLAEAPQQSRFSFYEMLPNFEVVVPEEDPDVAADVEPRAVVEPGVYVLQAGSFTAYADADRRRAELALQGIESNIQRVTIDDKTYHRVRIGPTDDLDELNMLRSRLRAARIDVLRIRLGD